MTLLQRYNCLDTIATFRLWETLSEGASPEAKETYALSKSLSAPLLFAMLKGIRVDLETMSALHSQFTQECKILEDLLDDITLPLGMDVINLSSPVQVKWLFACLGEDLDSSDREALEQVAKADLDLAPVCNLILAWRDRAKMCTVLRPSLVDADGRMRTFYKVSGTETDRLSSSKNALWTGMNMQNIKRDEKASQVHRASIRSIFVSDPGTVFINVDLERADAWGVALEVLQSTGDRTYLNAVRSFDLHTTVSRLIWPNLDWSTHDWNHNIKVAKQFFYRQYDYRFMAKKAGHGCLPKDHEVLTESGWVSISTKPNRLATFNGSSITFTEVSTWTEYLHNGPMCSLEGTSISLLATPNHRIINTRSQAEGLLHETEAAHYLVNPGQIPLGWGYTGGSINVPEAALVAAIQADGEILGSKVRFNLRKERKIDRLISLCEALNVYWEWRGDRIIIDYNMRWPKHAGAYLLHWTEPCLRLWQAELKYWDGSIGNTAIISTHSTNLDHVQWCQTINRLLGFGGNIQKPSISGYGSVVYKVMENNRRWAWGKSITRTVVQNFHDYVYCPTVPSGMFLVRRNGKIHVTGNSNYLGQPRTLAIQMKIPTRLAQEAQDAYFAAFPGIRPWHLIKSKELQTTGRLTNLFGRTRAFHGRLDSMATLREAIAFLGQTTTAGSINRSLLQAWDLQLRRPDLGIEFLAQVHDSLLFQLPETTLPESLPLLLSTLPVPITVTDPTTNQPESHTIPLEASIGWNWSSHSSLNPDGLLPLENLSDPLANRAGRTRHPPAQELGFMDRRISSIHRGPQQPDHLPEMGGLDYLRGGP